jgi:Glycosyltransferase family 87
VTLARRRWGDPRWQLAGFVLAHIAIFAGVFRGVYTTPYSGTGLYYEYGSAIVAGHVPYRDVFVEYPPFALVFFTLPRMVGASFPWYYVWFQVEVVVGDLVVLVALYVARERSTAPWRVLTPYTALLLAVGPITLQQYDIFPAAMTLVAVICYARGRDSVAWAVLAVATMTKVYPVLLAPVFLMLGEGPVAPRIRRAAIVFVATCIVILLPLLVIAPSSLGRMMAFHSERGIHVESVYASVAFVARAVGLSIVGTVYTYRSWNIRGPAADVLARVATPVLAVSLVAAYAFISRHARRCASGATDIHTLATSSALVLLTGLVTSKVLSPQYLIWVLPILPLAVRPKRWLVWTLFAVVGLVTYYIYPLHYPELLALDPLAITTLAVRNSLLVTLTVLVAVSLRAACRTSAIVAEPSIERAGAA